MQWTVPSGDKALCGGEIDKICFRLCHSPIWTVLASFRTRKLQIWTGYGLVLDIAVIQ